jgi:hypothetical protein
LIKLSAGQVTNLASDAMPRNALDVGSYRRQLAFETRQVILKQTPLVLSHFLVDNGQAWQRIACNLRIPDVTENKM